MSDNHDWEFKGNYRIKPSSAYVFALYQCKRCQAFRTDTVVLEEPINEQEDCILPALDIIEMVSESDMEEIKQRLLSRSRSTSAEMFD